MRFLFSLLLLISFYFGQLHHLAHETNGEHHVTQDCQLCKSQNRITPLLAESFPLNQPAMKAPSCIIRQSLGSQIHDHLDNHCSRAPPVYT